MEITIKNWKTIDASNPDEVVITYEEEVGTDAE